MRYQHRWKNCVLLVLVDVIIFQHVYGEDDSNIWINEKLGFSQEFTISTNKRTKKARNIDEIRTNDAIAQNVKTSVSPEGYKSTHFEDIYAVKKYDRLEKYKKYHKYNDKDNHSTSKNTKDNSECKHTKKGKYKCTAFIAMIDDSTRAFLLQSVHGKTATLAATYQPNLLHDVAIFSNKARGSSLDEYDLSVSYIYRNTTLSVSRFRYDGVQANLLYDTVVGNSQALNMPFVTLMSIPKDTCNVDAYNVYETGNTAHTSFTQYNLESKSGSIISTYLQQGGCVDIYFFADKHKSSRWLCLAPNPSLTAYLRDPSTDTNYVPPPEANPVPLGSFYIGATAGRVCGKQYMAMMSLDVDPRVFRRAIMMSRLPLNIHRATVSLKYPFFKDTQVLFSITVSATSYGAIYSPPDTDIVYACIGITFWRFEDAYTKQVPLIPTVQTQHNWERCRSIISFKECPDEVYVRSDNGLWYSTNGGRSFNEVTTERRIRSSSFTGFAVPN